METVDGVDAPDPPVTVMEVHSIFEWLADFTRPGSRWRTHVELGFSLSGRAVQGKNLES